MLNRRILRVKVFKVLYAASCDRSVTLKEALAGLDASVEASRDLYLYLLALIPPVTAEAGRRIAAARGKFNPTEEDLHPNTKFADNAIAPLLASDPDFEKLLSRKKLSWDQDDVLVGRLLDALQASPAYAKYMSDPGRSIAADAALFSDFFVNVAGEDPGLDVILEERGICWADEIDYVLSCCARGVTRLAREKRFNLPPLYNSEILAASGQKVDDDRKFARTLITAAMAGMDRYNALIADSVRKWDSDRLYLPDLVLIALGLAEAESVPGIPLRVTINEYVDIASSFGTPKSSLFVNGLLDRLIGDLKQQGAIKDKQDK